MARFHFAWVDATETAFTAAHEREDEAVFGFSLEHSEGDFPVLALEIENPRVGLLSPSRYQWAWLSVSEDATATGGAVPLFFGRLVGVPEQIDESVVKLDFVGRPLDWAAQRAALAETLKAAPYWDPVFIDEARRDDPDSVLEARTALWHIDRITHEVTVSDIVSGEDGTEDFSADAFHDSIDITFGQAPVRRVHMEAEVFWNQTAKGDLDMTRQILAAQLETYSDASAQALGQNPPGLLQSYTGEGLIADWPTAGTRIGSGWTVAASSVRRKDGKTIPVAQHQIIFRNGTVGQFPVWSLKPEFVLHYECSRQRSETVVFDLEADVQALLTEPGDEELLTLAVSSQDVEKPVDPATTAEPDGAVPIGDVRRRSYFQTDRGQDSIGFLLALARARLMFRARAAEVSFEVDFWRALGLSCRMNGTITHDRLPGGTVSGKIISYTIAADGDSGALSAGVRLGCTLGKGNSVAAAVGTPSYVDAGYVNTGWQAYSGALLAGVSGGVVYGDISQYPLDDDGIDFLDFHPADALNALYITNGARVQRQVLASYAFHQISEAVTALNQAYTEICMDLKPLNAGPFETEFALSVSGLMVPETIDLGEGTA